MANLGEHVVICNALVRLYKDGKVRAFRGTEEDNTFFGLCSQFILSMVDEDGEIDYSKAEVDLLKQMHPYQIARTDIPVEEIIQSIKEDRTKNLYVVN